MVEPTLHFSHDEYARRIQKTCVAMQAAGVELLVVSDPANMAWLTGYDGCSYYVHQAVLLGIEGEPIWFGRQQDCQGAFRTCFMAKDKVIGYPDHYVQSTERHPMDFLAERIADLGWAAARVGVEKDNYWFSAAAFESLMRHLPNARFFDATGLVNWQRAVKSEQELTYMRTAARLTERIHRRIAELAEPGVRKCDLAAEIYDAGLRYDPDLGAGGDYPAIVPLMPSGAAAAAPHLTWNDEPLRAGEGTFFEVSGVCHRYHAPMSRTLYFGKPPRAFLEAEKAVLEGLEAGIAAAKAGYLCEDVASAFFGVLKKHGIEKDSRTGYPIGLGYPPDWGEHTMSFRAGDKTVLEENMTFHFMPGIWMEDWGLEITETIAIGSANANCLADVPRSILVKA